MLHIKCIETCPSYFRIGEGFLRLRVQIGNGGAPAASRFIGKLIFGHIGVSLQQGMDSPAEMALSLSMDKANFIDLFFQASPDILINERGEIFRMEDMEIQHTVDLQLDSVIVSSAFFMVRFLCGCSGRFIFLHLGSGYTPWHLFSLYYFPAASPGTLRMFRPTAVCRCRNDGQQTSDAQHLP